MTVGSGGIELVAYVALNEKELAQLVPKVKSSSESSSLSSIIDYVKTELYDSMIAKMPPYMIPAFVEVMEEIPKLPNGKTDRNKLPPPITRRLSSICSETPFIPPETCLEHEIHDVWCSVFGVNQCSMADNFFMDLGGHSMAASQVVSAFRRGGSYPLNKLGISEIYEYPTIRGLCKYLQPLVSESRDEKQQANYTKSEPLLLKEDLRIVHSSTEVWLCGIFQFAFAYALSLVFSVPFAALLRNGFHPFVAFTIIGATTLPILLVLPVIAKWTIIGRFRPGRYPLWGTYYVRCWVTNGLMALSPLSLLTGTPFLAWYLRMLGARIGHGCHLGSGRLYLPDLINIEDGVSIGYGAAIETFYVKGGWLYLAPITIEKNAFIGSGSVLLPGSMVGAGSVLLEQSLVSEGQKIPRDETWSGSPSRRRESPDPILAQLASCSPPQQWSCRLMFVFLLVLVFFFMVLLPCMIFGPTFAFFWFLSGGGLTKMTMYAPAAGALHAFFTCFAIALSKHIIMHRTPQGILPLRSLYGIRKWASDVLMQSSLSLTNSLYSTLYTVPWLRCLGASIGPRSEGKRGEDQLNWRRRKSNLTQIDCFSSNQHFSFDRLKH